MFSLLPVTCMALAIVKTNTLLSSSESVLMRFGFVSEQNVYRVRLGMTSEFPKPVINLSATLSMLQESKKIPSNIRVKILLKIYIFTLQTKIILSIRFFFKFKIQ